MSVKLICLTVGLLLIIKEYIVTEAFHGLFTFRPSTTTNITECDLEGLTSVEQTEKWTCYSQCLQDPCCRALSLSDCSTACYVNEDLDFVKEIPGSPFPFPQCSRSMHLGGDGGGEFTTMPEYGQGSSSISRITVFIHSSGLLKGIEIEFSNGIVSTHGESSEKMTCLLDPDEYIVTVVAYGQMHKYYTTIAGVEFVTTQRVCGVFGKDTSEVEAATGHRLLFMDGKRGNLLDALIPHFDDDCSLG